MTDAERDRAFEIAVAKAAGWRIEGRVGVHGDDFFLVSPTGKLNPNWIRLGGNDASLWGSATPHFLTDDEAAGQLVDAVVPSRYTRFSLDFTGTHWAGLAWRPSGGGGLIPSSAPTRAEAITRAIGKALGVEAGTA